MVVFEIDEFLKGAGIEQIKTIGEELIVITRLKGRFTIPIKEDEEKTGLQLERKCGKFIEIMGIQKICTLIHHYWDEIQNEVNPVSEESEQLAEDDPERYKPKFHFNTFEEWQSKIEDRYYNLHKVIDNNLPFIWPATELILAVKAILHIKEITLPFLILIIGRAAGGKTVPIRSLRGRNHTYYTDNFNPPALVSHMVTTKKMDEKDQHMILRIRNKLVLDPEMAPLFSKREDDLRETISLLIRAADGEGLETDSGVGHRGYSGKYQFNLIGATTEPAWYVHRILAKLGPKLLFFRLGKNDPTHDELMQILQGEEFTGKKARIDAAMNEYLDVFESCPTSETEQESFLPKISLAKFKPDDDIAALHIASYLAKLLSHLRGIVQTREVITDDGKSDYIYDSSDTEDPRRAAEQIRNLMKGRALSQGRTSIGMEDAPLAIKVALSTAPLQRSKIFIELLKKGPDGFLSNSELKDLLRIHQSTAKRAMIELDAVGLVDFTEEATGSEHRSTITLKDNLDFKWFTTKGFHEAQREDDRRYQEWLNRQKEVEKDSVRCSNSAPPMGSKNE